MQQLFEQQKAIDKQISDASPEEKDDLSNIYENRRLIKEKYNWEKKQKDYLTLFKTQ